MDLPLDCWKIIASYLPFGNWKAFILINKTTFSLNTEEELNKRVNPLWSFIKKHPKAFAIPSCLKYIAASEWTSPDMYFNFLMNNPIKMDYIFYLYRNPYITYQFIDYINTNEPNFESILYKLGIGKYEYLHYIKDINEIYYSLDKFEKNISQENKNLDIAYLTRSHNIPCFGYKFNYYNDIAKKFDEKIDKELLKKDITNLEQILYNSSYKILSHPDFSLIYLEEYKRSNREMYLSNKYFYSNPNINIDFIKSNNLIKDKNLYTKNVVFSIQTIKENPSIFCHINMFGNPNIKWSDIKNINPKKRICKLLARNTFNSDIRYNFYHNKIYNNIYYK